MKNLFAVLCILLLVGSAKFSGAATICPTTSYTNTDCGYVLTIAPGGAVSGAAVPTAAPYEGSDDVLVGVVNNSGATYTGSISLTGSDIFGFENDGICVSLAGGYCSASQIGGTDPADYQGPLNTFTVLNSDSGSVNITGLAAGATTFFSLENSPGSANITVTGSSSGNAVTPEPSSFVLLGTGLAGILARLRGKVAL